MNTISRGFRNAFRNQIRTFSIVIILGLSIGLALAMLVARASVEDKIETIKASVGNNISIAPAGLRGFQGGGEPLSSAQINKVEQLPNVTTVASSLSDRLDSENTNLKSAVDLGSFGQRQANRSGVGFQQAPPAGGRRFSGQQGEITRTFTPPVTVTGANEVVSPATYGGDSVVFKSGQAFDPSIDKNVAVVGSGLADKNNLSVGSTFTAYGKKISVVGIYDAGNEFANGGLIMPLQTLQRLADLKDKVTSASVTINSVDNIAAAVDSIKSALGDTADVTSNQESASQVIKPLESVKTISSFSLVGAVIAGAAIILLTMVMIVRERRREIGVFKAIGASNLKVMVQFMSEAVTLTALGLVAGLIIGAAAASPITDVLVNNSNSSQQTVQVDGTNQAGRARQAGGQSRGFRNIGSNTLDNARSVKASVGLGIIGYGVATAILIAIIGSAIPALLISKIRPAEVMRAE